MILAERNQITPDTRPRLCVSRVAIHVTSGEYVHWMNETPMKCESKTSQWPFQEPKPEVPTIYEAYIRPM